MATTLPYVLEASVDEGTSNDSIQTAVGIDIGTSHCSVAVWRDSTVYLLRNSADLHRSTSSNILFRGLEGPDDMGTTSEQDCLSGNTIFNVKRLLGRLDTDPVVRKSLNTSQFFIQSFDLGVRPFLGALGHKVWRSTTPEEVLAILLVELKAMAEADLGRKVQDAVITVPVSFSRFQLTRMERACGMAGLRVMRFVPEPTAVALLYAQRQLSKLGIVEEVDRPRSERYEEKQKGDVSPGQPPVITIPVESPTDSVVQEGISAGGGQEQEVEKLAFIFNMGAGHTDVALTATASGVSQVKAMLGDVVGGEDMIWNLVHFVASKLGLQLDVDDNMHGRRDSDTEAQESGMSPRRYGRLPETAGRLRFACERAMHLLSTEDQADVVVEDERLPDKTATLTITRAMFEEVNAPILERCGELVRQCLQAAQVQPEAVSDVILAGGCSAIPKIHSTLEDIMHGKKFYQEMDSLEAAVRGAAIEGAITSGLSDTSGALDLLAIQAVPRTLGIQGTGGEFLPILTRNSTIPTRRDIVVTTTRANQAEALIMVFEGEQKQARDNHLLGFFKVSAIPPAPKGVPLISVCMDVDATNVVRVVAGVYMPGSDVPAGNLTEVRMPTVDDGQAWCSDAIAKKFAGTLDVAPVVPQSSR